MFSDQPMPLAPVVQKLQEGSLTSVDAVQQCLNRIDQVDDQVQAWTSVDAPAALAAAQAADKRAPEDRPPLHGVPVGIKDIIDVKGMPTTCGSCLRKDHIADEDAAIVQELRQLGAIVLGKTVTTEFAYFSPGPTRNPHALDHTPGGSSSGSAAAVAAGMVPLAVGTQTAASLIRPASYCGIYGYVSPVGTWPTKGIVGLSPTLDSVGFFTTDLEGIELMMQVQDNVDASAPPAPSRPAPEVCVWRPGPSFEMESQTLDHIDRARDVLANHHWNISHIDLDSVVDEMIELHVTIMAYESAGERAEEARHLDLLSPQFSQLLTSGRRISSHDYHQALSRRHALQDYFAERFSNSVVLAPSSQGPAPAGIEATGSPLMSRPWQLLGWPALNFPSAHPGQLPVGLQITGPVSAWKRLSIVGEELFTELTSLTCVLP